MTIEYILYFSVLIYLSLWFTIVVFTLISLVHLRSIQLLENKKLKAADIILTTINLREKLMKETGMTDNHPLIQQLFLQIMSLQNEFLKIDTKEKKTAQRLDGFLGALNNFLSIATFGKLKMKHTIDFKEREIKDESEK